MKNWKGYNILDLLLILSGITTIFVVSFIFSSPWYIVWNTILGLLCVFTQAKGKIITQFLGIAWFSLYVVISYSQKYYGEAIIYSLILIPLYIYGAIHWLRNKDKQASNTVLVRGNLSKREWIAIVIGFFIVSIGVYFILKALDTAQLLISTLSFVSMLPAIYLLVRRCKWNQVAFLVNDFIVPLLWISLVIEGQTIFITMCIYHIFQITYDLYGLIEWIRLEKKQKSLQEEYK